MAETAIARARESAPLERIAMVDGFVVIKDDDVVIAEIGGEGFELPSFV